MQSDRTILSPGEIAALRVLCKRHARLAASTGTAPNANVVSALDKLAALADDYPARIASAGIRRLEIHDDATRERLIAEFDCLHDAIRDVAETFGVADPGAAIPGELMHELHDATHSPYGPSVNETRALGLSS